MECEVGLDLMFRCRSDECVHCLPDLLGASIIHAGSRKCGRLGLDPEPEVDHVEDVVVGPDGRGLDGERRRLGHREHERPTALERFDQPFGPQPRHRLADHRPRDPVLVDELGLRWQLVSGWQVAGEDLVLQPGDDALRQCRRHR